MAARPKESPEVLAMLKKLDDAMIGCAPTSHMFRDGASGRLRELPIASTLGSTSALRDRKRESVQDVLDKFGAAAAAGRPMDKEALASSLRFAVDNDSVGPGAAAAAHALERTSKGPSRQQFGASTLAPEDVSALADDRGHLPLDAEVQKLSRHYLSGTAGPAASTLYRSFADTSTLGQGKAPLRDTVDITLRAAGAAPHWQGTYAGEFKFTNEVRLPAGKRDGNVSGVMRSAVSGRDYTHALKADEETRYAEERMKFDRMVGGPKPGPAKGAAAAAPTKAAKAPKAK